MTNRALGLIEVKGYLGAVVAADAALKAANVSLLNIETVKSGLNTVQLVGDVSAVRSAVDAAVDLVGDKPYYLASHVISRLDNQTDLLFTPPRRQTEGAAEKIEAAEAVLAGDQVLVTEVADAVLEAPSDQDEPAERYSRAQLEKMKVVELRSLAYHQDTIELSKKEIKFANKKQLVDALLNIIGKE